jgi:hypothetical protein
MNAHRVLVRLAHEVLDRAQLDPGTFQAVYDIHHTLGYTKDCELKERLKQRAADVRVDYDSGAITRALDAALYQRRRRRG